MPDEIIIENIENILESIILLEERFSKIKNENDFVDSSYGVLLLDAVSMRLQVIGELIKKIDKIDNLFLGKYPEIEWDKIMKLRDIISHHYQKIDHEIIYDICKNHLPNLKQTFLKLLRN
jgi:uncharacterized protein with HEPN domain